MPTFVYLYMLCMNICIQVNLLQPPDNLLDVLARHNIPSSLRDRACYACALIFELKNNNNEVRMKTYTSSIHVFTLLV